MAQAAIAEAHGWPLDRIAIVPMVATGDRIQDRALADVGGKALWTRELDRALLAGEIDAAVHSLKDVETIRPAQFALSAMLPRADVRDRLIGADSIAALPLGATVGCASPRRTAQLLRLRPDLSITLLRGNVGTRLRRIADGEMHATLLAAAGLDRLGLSDVGHPLPLDQWLPAPSQGAVGIEVRSEDADARAVVAAVDDATTARCVGAERALLAALGGNCHSAVAALAQSDGDGSESLRAQIFSPDGRDMCEASVVVDHMDAVAALAAHLLRDAPPSITAHFSVPDAGSV